MYPPPTPTCASQHRNFLVYGLFPLPGISSQVQVRLSPLYLSLYPSIRPFLALSSSASVCLVATVLLLSISLTLGGDETLANHRHLRRWWLLTSS